MNHRLCSPGQVHFRFFYGSIDFIILVIRLLRVARVARKMDHFAEYSGVVLILLVGAFVLFGHWLACMWFAIGKLQIVLDNKRFHGYHDFNIFSRYQYDLR